tara:strand:- start:5 stop:298 length:294 start_codon:yes stop_codon:yes gene_type:complete
MANDRATKVTRSRVGFRNVDRNPKPIPGGSLEVIFEMKRLGVRASPCPKISRGWIFAAFHAGLIPNKQTIAKADNPKVNNKSGWCLVTTTGIPRNPK